VERFLRWLDDLDDLLVVTRTQGRSLLVTLLLLVLFLSVLGAVFLIGPPVLHASP
jgi:hypothetical protein